MSIYHGGVIKAAGVVHVGTPTTQVRNYVSDARGYSRGLMVEHHIEEARRVAASGDECQRRSWVRAVEQLVEAGMFLVLCGCLVALAWLVSTAPEGE